MKEESSHCKTSERIHYWFKGDRAHLPPSCTSFKLSAGRVAHFQLREYFLVSKKLKGVSGYSPQGPAKRQIESMNILAEENTTQWSQPKHEENQFSIDRVIKYLCD